MARRPPIKDTTVATWDAAELMLWASGPDGAENSRAYEPTFSKYDPTPGTGRTGMYRVPPNNYPFYGERERYVPAIQADGGQLSEWTSMYNPSREEAERDRELAFQKRIPHGYIEPGDKYKGLPTLDIWVVSNLHDDGEYGASVDPVTGKHSGGPFQISVAATMRVEDLRLVIRDIGGILPALQRLSYAGKHLDDPQRTLEHYGVGYWHKKFPHWPIKVRG